ncbi:NB-ARC domain, LRR domain containing protein [Parasponia andersonii]|uniref:NB-ARC domain, LRR domain containing protein n=1 Tax=Parasponia andersonii TaxID=3476 RepID=A0A2P5D4U8_PARAD|nr:NB-ARC domain, LRR domain containing protein [Parasponia andersonii]
MADVVLSPLLQVVLDKLATPFLETVSDYYGIKNEIRKFWRTLPMVHAVLEDAEDQQLTNRPLRLWLEELKQVAYDLEDLIDEFSPEAVKSRNPFGNHSFSDQVSVLIPTPFGQFLNFRDLLGKLNQVKGTLESLVAEKSNFNLRESVISNRGNRTRRRARQTGSFIIESEVFGRDEDKERVVKLLVSNDRSRGDVLIVSVVGLGGLGKTTLAQLAYNDERVASHFDLRIWVCVNDEFDLVKIMISIIEGESRSKYEFLGMDVLQFRLRELLLGKRYLLVLDDVWNEDQSEWDNLLKLLKSGGEGSSVLVTSRSEKVASIMGTTCIYHLQGLSEESCWDLFKQRAFGNNEGDRSNLFPIGKQIVKKCGGVPLAVKTLGSLMRFKKEEREWLFVMESGLWDMSESESGALPALRLSYSHLPPHLKGCFAYCSIFPKNYVIKKEKLIHLWIAAGFIRSPEGMKSLEFVGNECFNDLVWIFFFQDIQKSGDGNIIECKMHDLIHDLAQSVAGREFTMMEHDSTARDLSVIRHSSVVCNFKLHTIPEALYEAKMLRTLILLLPKGNLGEVPSGLFSSFRYLRVLDLSGSGIKKLHESISSFVFLKFIDLSYTHIQTLPEGVCKLLNLQVMNLLGCHNLTELPSEIARLSKLRHLMINGCYRLAKMPANMGKLVYLQTLSMFIVGKEADKNLSQLQSLNLGGDLNIRQLENVKDASEARKAELISKRNLRSLCLSWKNDDSGLNRNNEYDGTQEAEVLDFLQPHKYLKGLSIERYEGSHFPRWIGALKLPNLTEVTLVNCRRCKQLPALGQLPFLKVLYMQGMDTVKNIGREFYGESTGIAFPSLGELTLTDFPNLEYWWTANGREGFPSLIKLKVNRCLKLNNMPSFPSLQHLELRACNDIVLRSASNLTSLTNLTVEEFPEQLIFLDLLFQNNAPLMSLKIGSCPRLHCISPNLAKLVNLRKLTVRWCGELLSLPEGLENLTSLESLEIIECHSLISLPESMKGLISLRSLSIENCNSITTLSQRLQCLTALEHLTIMYCPKLYALPTDWRHLSTLKSLSVLNCPELMCLPEGLRYATALQNMEIRACPGLQALPEWVANLTSLRSLALSDCHNLPSLPGSFQCLSFLQHLSIRECPNLEERCKKDVGEDWPKMKHIQHVYIGSQHFRAYDDTGGSSSSL